CRGRPPFADDSVRCVRVQPLRSCPKRSSGHESNCLQGGEACTSRAEIFFAIWERAPSLERLCPRFAAGRLPRQQKLRYGVTPRPCHSARMALHLWIPSFSIATKILTVRPKKFSACCANPPPSAIATHAPSTTRSRTSSPPCTRLSTNKSCLAAAPAKSCAWLRPLFWGPAKNSCKPRLLFPRSANSRKAQAAKSQTFL